MVKKIKGSFLFKIKGSDGKVHEWLVDLKTPPGTITKGTGTMCKLVHHWQIVCFVDPHRFEGKLYIGHKRFRLCGSCVWKTRSTESKYILYIIVSNFVQLH